MKLSFIRNHEIDKILWDQKIDTAINGRIYSYSWYLDALTANRWDAIISKDYQFIMPIPYSQRLIKGRRYILQPVYCQQLGVFGNELPTKEILSKFISNLPSKVALFDYHFNEENTANLTPNKYIKYRPNMLLALDRPYEKIRLAYSKTLRKRLQKRKGQFTLRCNQGSLEHFLKQHNHWNPVDKQINSYIKTRRKELFSILVRKNMANIYTGQFSENHSVDSAVFIANSHKRLYLITSWQNNNNKVSNQKNFILNSIIEKYANSEVQYFDFEGSSISKIRQFNHAFRPIDVAYASMNMDKRKKLEKILERSLYLIKNKIPHVKS